MRRLLGALALVLAACAGGAVDSVDEPLPASETLGVLNLSPVPISSIAWWETRVGTLPWGGTSPEPHWQGVTFFHPVMPGEVAFTTAWNGLYPRTQPMPGPLLVRAFDQGGTLVSEAEFLFAPPEGAVWSVR